MRRIALLLILVFVSTSSFAAEMYVDLNPVIVEGENEQATLLITTPELFEGTVEVNYENMNSTVSSMPLAKEEFKGAAPYSVTYSWNVTGERPGDYLLDAKLMDSTGAIVGSAITQGTVNSSIPVIISKSPDGILTSSTVNLVVATDEPAICKYSQDNNSFDSMETFTLTKGGIHRSVIRGLGEGEHTFYVLCEDLKGYRMENAEKIIFVIDLAPTATVALSDESPVRAGTIEVRVQTSEPLDFPPTLYYSFNDEPSNKKIVSLTGSSTIWEGYMIITAEDNNKVGTFQFSGKDKIGTVGTRITDGMIFLVDTSKPLAPIDLETSVQYDGSIKLRWFYDSGDAEGFNIYRSEDSGVSYVDFYAYTGNLTQYIDNSVEHTGTYYYKVAAVDKADNIGILSDEIYATSIFKIGGSEEPTEPEPEETPKVLPPDSVKLVDDKLKEIEQLEMDMVNAKKNFDSTSPEIKDLLTELDLWEVMDESSSVVNNLKTSLGALKLGYIEHSELMQRLDKADLEIKKIKNKYPQELTVYEGSDYIEGYDSVAAKSYASTLFNELDDAKLKKYLRLNEDLQKDVQVEVHIDSFKVKYLDEASKDRTLVTKKISYLNPVAIEDVSLIEMIPKAIAEDVAQIEFISNGYDVLESDPVVKWGVLKLDFEGRQIQYALNKKIDSAKFKDTRMVVLSSPVGVMLDNNLVGYSIFSLFDGMELNLEMIMLIIGIFTIVILGLAYIFYFRKNRHPRASQSIKRKKIIPAKKAQASNAKGSEYGQGGMIRQLLNRETLAGNFLKTGGSVSLGDDPDYSLMVRLINEAYEYLSIEDYQKASNIYSTIQLLYGKIPKDLRREVYSDCVQIQRSISFVKQAQKKSIFE